MIIKLDEVDSTNAYAKTHLSMSHGDAVVACTQTAGRGQRGNTWEAEPGKNLTFSVVVCPGDLQARDQFRLSMAIAIAVVETLRPILPDPQFLKIKWPNDIYYGDKKLAGMLIENSLQGSYIHRSVIGLGLNVNQTDFINAGPNPVSLKQIIGTDSPLEPLLELLVNNIAAAPSTLIPSKADQSTPPTDNTHPEASSPLKSRYMSMLWRNDGPHYWRDTDTGQLFQAAIHDITPEGYLTLLHPDASTSTHPLKTISPSLPE